MKNNAPPPLHRSASSNNHLKHQVCGDKISRPFLAVFYHLRGLTESQIGFLGFLRPMMSFPTVPLWSALADLLGLKKVRKRWVLQLLILINPNSAPKKPNGLSGLIESIGSAPLHLEMHKGCGLRMSLLHGTYWNFTDDVHVVSRLCIQVNLACYFATVCTTCILRNIFGSLQLINPSPLTGHRRVCCPRNLH